MGARTQNTLICFGKKKQTAIGSAQTVADMWRLPKLNAESADPIIGTEDDADEYGKSDEAPTQVFLTEYSANFPIQKYGTSEFLAWAFAFALGKVTVTGTGPYTYAITPLSPVTDGLELPYFTHVEQNAANDIDRMLVGCAINDVQVTIARGAGRQTVQVRVTVMHSGLLTMPSGIVIPAATAEHPLVSGSLAATINGTDYIAATARSIERIQIGWSNNLQWQAFPGSGFQAAGDPTTGAIAGRLEYTKRVPSFSMTVRTNTASDEFTKLKALTSGSATVTLSQGANNSFSAAFPKMPFRSVVREEANGISVVTIAGSPLRDAVNGWLNVTAITSVQSICQ